MRMQPIHGARSGAGYDGVAVFGPHAAETMRLAGVAPGRILEIGPLGHDDLQPAELDLDAVPRRVLFASQRVDEEYPYLAESGKRLALESAFALAAAAGPAAVHILPHPTEAERDLRKVVASVSRAVDIPVAIEPTGRLHSLLPGAFALVTVSSQSIYEAVVTGVPAIAVYPPGSEVPVSYVSRWRGSGRIIGARGRTDREVAPGARPPRGGDGSGACRAGEPARSA